MGEMYSVTCRNKNCRYHVHLREGVGMMGFARMKQFEQQIISGEVHNPAAQDSIHNGAKLRDGGIYLCRKCKEFKRSNTYYLIENLVYSPYGTPRYDVTFPFGEPTCDQCGDKLEFIRNILSSKVKCPRCGGELKGRPAGCFD